MDQTDFITLEFCAMNFERLQPASINSCSASRIINRDNAIVCNLHGICCCCRSPAKPRSLRGCCTETSRPTVFCFVVEVSRRSTEAQQRRLWWRVVTSLRVGGVRSSAVAATAFVAEKSRVASVRRAASRPQWDVVGAVRRQQVGARQVALFPWRTGGWRSTINRRSVYLFTPGKWCRYTCNSLNFIENKFDTVVIF